MATWHTVGSKTISVTVKKKEQFKVSSWSVSIDKTTISPNEQAKVGITVNWSGAQSAKFKASIEAFGYNFVSDEVIATKSPYSFNVIIQTPKDIKPGTYQIKVTLLAYY